MRWTGWLLVLMVGLCGGCGSAFHMSAPAGFVELDDDAYDWRATNADGVVIGVRAFANEPRGDLEFWAGAIDARLRRSFQAEAVLGVETEGGLAGVQIRYTGSRHGRSYRYWATVYVHRDRVYLLETAGDAELFEPERSTLEATLAAFRPS